MRLDGDKKTFSRTPSPTIRLLKGEGLINTVWYVGKAGKRPYKGKGDCNAYKGKLLFGKGIY